LNKISTAVTFGVYFCWKVMIHNQYHPVRRILELEGKTIYEIKNKICKSISYFCLIFHLTVAVVYLEWYNITWITYCIGIVIMYLKNKKIYTCLSSWSHQARPNRVLLFRKQNFPRPICWRHFRLKPSDFLCAEACRLCWRMSELDGMSWPGELDAVLSINGFWFLAGGNRISIQCLVAFFLIQRRLSKMYFRYQLIIRCRLVAT
jgi:hypothetical protein